MELRYITNETDFVFLIDTVVCIAFMVAVTLGLITALTVKLPKKAWTGKPPKKRRRPFDADNKGE